MVIVSDGARRAGARRMTEVADQARVSPATVSRVLNNTGNVRADLRARVLAAVGRLDYHPDAIAQSLRRRLTHTLGVVVPKITNTFYTDAVRGIEEAALRRGYTVLLCSSNEDFQRERRYLELMRSKRVDGVILSPSHGPADRFAPLVRDQVPIVLMHRRVADIVADAVVVDNRGGTRQAIRHLAERGYAAVGMIAGPLTLSTIAERHAAFCEALAEHHLPADDDLVAFAEYDEASGTAAAARLLDRRPPPRAIFVALNVLMLGVLRAVQSRGLRVPDDVALVGFDDLRWATVVTPPLTMVAEPTFEVGERAAEMLIERVEGYGPATPRVEVLKPTLVVRGSS